MSSGTSRDSILTRVRADSLAASSAATLSRHGAASITDSAACAALRRCRNLGCTATLTPGRMKRWTALLLEPRFMDADILNEYSLCTFSDAGTQLIALIMMLSSPTPWPFVFCSHAFARVVACSISLLRHAMGFNKEAGEVATLRTQLTSVSALCGAISAGSCVVALSRPDTLDSTLTRWILLPFVVHLAANAVGIYSFVQRDSPTAPYDLLALTCWRGPHIVVDLFAFLLLPAAFMSEERNRSWLFPAVTAITSSSILALASLCTWLWLCASYANVRAAALQINGNAQAAAVLNDPPLIREQRVGAATVRRSEAQLISSLAISVTAWSTCIAGALGSACVALYAGTPFQVTPQRMLLAGNVLAAAAAMAQAVAICGVVTLARCVQRLWDCEDAFISRFGAHAMADAVAVDAPTPMFARMPDAAAIQAAALAAAAPLTLLRVSEDRYERMPVDVEARALGVQIITNPLHEIAPVKRAVARRAAALRRLQGMSTVSPPPAVLQTQPSGGLDGAAAHGNDERDFTGVTVADGGQPDCDVEPNIAAAASSSQKSLAIHSAAGARWFALHSMRTWLHAAAVPGGARPLTAEAPQYPRVSPMHMHQTQLARGALARHARLAHASGPSVGARLPAARNSSMQHNASLLLSGIQHRFSGRLAAASPVPLQLRVLHPSGTSAQHGHPPPSNSTSPVPVVLPGAFESGSPAFHASRRLASAPLSPLRTRLNVRLSVDIPTPREPSPRIQLAADAQPRVWSDGGRVPTHLQTPANTTQARDGYLYHGMHGVQRRVRAHLHTGEDDSSHTATEPHALGHASLDSETGPVTEIDDCVPAAGLEHEDHARPALHDVKPSVVTSSMAFGGHNSRTHDEHVCTCGSDVACAHAQAEMDAAQLFAGRWRAHAATPSSSSSSVRTRDRSLALSFVPRTAVQSAAPPPARVAARTALTAPQTPTPAHFRSRVSCSICYDAPADAVFLECGHAGVFTLT